MSHQGEGFRCAAGKQAGRCGNGRGRFCLTVDGDGNCLVQSVAVGTDEGRDLAKGVDSGLARASRHQLEFKTVGLRDHEDRDSARVFLPHVLAKRR